MILRQVRTERLVQASLLVLVALVLAACVGDPAASGGPLATPIPTPLVPAQPGAAPISFSVDS